MIEQKQSPQRDNSLKWIIAAIAGIGFLVWIASLGGTNTDAVSSSAPQSTEANNTLESTEAELRPPQPMPFDGSAAQRGYRQFQMIAAAHVPGSSEIFSRNCYEAVGKPIDWHQLDRCGAYDALAVRWTEENDDVAGNDDLTYFQSEAAATRYLQAATAGGLAAGQADARWATLQSMALKARLAKRTTEPAVVPMDPDQGADEASPTDDGDSDDGVSDGNAVDPTTQSE
jgi:hypothetical protein